MARRPPFLVFRGRIGSPLEQELGCLAVALCASDDQGSVAELIAHVHVGSVIEKERGDVTMIGERGLEERGPPLHVAMVDGSAVLDQVTADVEAAVLGREAERSSTPDVCVVECRASRMEPADQIEIPRVEDRQEQGVAPEVIFRIDAHPAADDSFDGGAIVLPDGVEQTLLGGETLRNARLSRAHEGIS